MNNRCFLAFIPVFLAMFLLSACGAASSVVSGGVNNSGTPSENATPTPTVVATGSELYQQSCFACHSDTNSKVSQAGTQNLAFWQSKVANMKARSSSSHLAGLSTAELTTLAEYLRDK